MHPRRRRFGANERRHVPQAHRPRVGRPADLYEPRTNDDPCNEHDTIHKVYNPEPGPEVQQIDIHTPIRSLEVRIANPAGFIGYGIVFENKNGVSLDNYSIRGNSGLALFGTNAAVNARIGAMRGYDLIILQYGLNVMSADVRITAPMKRLS